VWRRVGEKWVADRKIRIAVKSSSHPAFFSPEGELLACLDGSTIVVWDMAVKEKLHEFPVEPGWTMQNAVFDTANRRLISSYRNKDAGTAGWATWSLDTGERSPPVNMPSFGETYRNAIDLARDGRHLAIGFDEALLVYDMTGFQRTSFFGFDSTK